MIFRYFIDVIIDQTSDLTIKLSWLHPNLLYLFLVRLFLDQASYCPDTASAYNKWVFLCLNAIL